MTFHDFSLGEQILSTLEKMGYREPTPIQSETIPLVLDGKDVIGLAQTGSGKTAACAIPVCDKVRLEQKAIQALIIVPTRELALQYVVEAQKIGKEKGVRAFALFGGESYDIQEAKLQHGVHVLVATPGRLIDFIYSQRIDLTQVETLILDEADEMLNMGFYDDLEFIMQCLVHEHQTLLFSATMPVHIRKIALQHMKDPVEVILTEKRAIPERIRHQFCYCQYQERQEKLIELLGEMQPTQAIIFCQSRRQVEEVCQKLRATFSKVDLLHAGLGQDLRTIITDKFRALRIRYLVATDVAARGLDFQHVSHVFIYQLSSDVEMYVHRTGRTGRSDRHGSAVTLVTNKEMPFLKRVLALIQKEPEWLGLPPTAAASVSVPEKHQPRRRRFPRQNPRDYTNRE